LFALSICFCYIKGELFLFVGKDVKSDTAFCLEDLSKDSNLLCAEHTAGGNTNGTR
jgi:hypothetical protein